MNDPTFTYQQVEAAILRSYGWTDVARKALGARLRNYANLGLGPAAKPGKGARVAYTEEDILKWVAALELQILGMAPAESIKFILAEWSKFKDAVVFQGSLAKQIAAMTREERDEAKKRKIQVIQASTDVFSDLPRFKLLNITADEDGRIKDIPAANNYLLVFDLRRRFQIILSWVHKFHDEDRHINYVVEQHPDRVAAALRKAKRAPKE
jgi:DNA-binding transcriptional MerR regulator